MYLANGCASTASNVGSQAVFLLCFGGSQTHHMQVKWGEWEVVRFFIHQAETFVMLGQF